MGKTLSPPREHVEAWQRVHAREHATGEQVLQRHRRLWVVIVAIAAAVTTAHQVRH